MNTKPTVGNIEQTEIEKAEEVGAGEAGAIEPGEAVGQVGEVGEEAGTKLGIKLCCVTAERTEATMPVVGNRQPYGVLHGGATALLAEHTASIAGEAWAEKRGLTVVGANLTINHVRPGKSGTVRCVAQAQHLGRRTAVYAFQVVSESSGELISFGTVSCQVVPKTPNGNS